MSDDYQRFIKMLRMAQDSGATYTSFAGSQLCQRCGFREDCRMGACFRCADFIKGKNNGNGIHELWDRNRPDNRWFVTVPA